MFHTDDERRGGTDVDVPIHVQNPVRKEGRRHPDKVSAAS